MYAARSVYSGASKTVSALRKELKQLEETPNRCLSEIARLLDGASATAATARIESLTGEAEVGKIYKGKVRKIVDFGAFVEIMPGTDGLVHISQLAPGRVERVSDVLKEGDEVYVKVLEIDKQGKIRLSRKEALAAQQQAPT
jgi:polyribonucleotide nucleotidyltransferase